MPVRYFKRVEGNRVYLSPIRVDDAELYLKWMNDPAVAVNFGFAHRLFSLAQEEAELVELSGRWTFAIVEKGSDRLLGNVFFMDMDHVYRIAEVGVFIGEAADRGKGYGGEALSLLLSYGFDFLDLHNILLHVHEDNQAAIKCYKKLGFRDCGRRTEAVYKNGKRVDMLSMELLKTWFAEREKVKEKDIGGKPRMGNAIQDALLERRTIRGYKPEALSKEQVAALAEAALASPSANNAQPWRLKLITNKPLIEEFDKAIFESFKVTLPEVYERSKSRGSTVLYHAPLVVLILTPQANPAAVDVGILSENLAISAVGLGLGSAILGLPGFLFKSPEAAEIWRKKLEIPDGYDLALTVVVGYKADGVEVRAYAPDFEKVSYIE
jgi:RimJ/RimL family protein N-acetyltransferase/nitroreductase